MSTEARRGDEISPPRFRGGEISCDGRRGGEISPPPLRGGEISEAVFLRGGEMSLALDLLGGEISPRPLALPLDGDTSPVPREGETLSLPSSTVTQ